MLTDISNLRSRSQHTETTREFGLTTAALASGAKRNNLTLCMTVVVDQGTSNANITGSGTVEVPDRYLWMVVWNATSIPLNSTANSSKCSLTPFRYEMQ